MQSTNYYLRSIMAVIKQEHALYCINYSDQPVASQTDSTVGVLVKTTLPQDFGFDDIRALMEACPDFIRSLRSKGYVYATTFDTFENCCWREKRRGANNGKPWKRRRGGKNRISRLRAST